MVIHETATEPNRFALIVADETDATRITAVLEELGWAQATESRPSLIIADGSAAIGPSRDGAYVVRIGPAAHQELETALADDCQDYWTRPLSLPLVRLRLRAIGEQLRHAGRLREKEQQFQSMVLNNPGVVYRCRFDEGWTMEFISQRVEAIMGYPPEDFVERGRTYASIMAPEDQERVAAEVQAALDKDQSFSLEYRVFRADGEMIWVSSRGRGIRGPDGALRYLDGAIFDISPEKAASELLRRGAEELQHNNAELERLDALKNRMFQNVSHELRTPLSLILAPVERLLTRSADDDSRATLQSIRSNSLRLLEQINGILDLARIDSQGIAIRPRTIDVGEYLRRLSEDVGPAASERGIDFKCVAPPAPLCISMDPGHLERILLNLVANALKFTPEGGAIQVRAAVEGSSMVFEVDDTGCGIPEDAQARIFDRFAQVEDKPGNAPSGTGIGLSMVRELTTRMRGELGLESAPGRGSKFTITFNAADVVAPSTEGVAGPSSESRSGFATFDRQAQLESLRVKQRAAEVLRGGERGPLVLVAEDDPDLALELVRCLSERFRVIAVPDGIAAFEVLEHDIPAAIVSDVGMPRMDGIELCRRIRERADFQQMGIVLLSAHADVEDRIRGRRTGVDAYMTKPFHPEELVAAVEGILRSRLRLVGDFEVHERLGRGGQGTVFLGESIETGEFVALKLLSGSPSLDTRRRDALRAELGVLVALDHPNIVRVVDQGADDDMTYLAMEYLDGVSLRELLDNSGRVRDEEATSIALGIGGALAYLHGQGIVHRDLKPSNVLLRRDGPRSEAAITIIDFGIALSVSGGTGESGDLSGTPAYMAPELLETGAEAASPASDVYAFGVLTFALLTGEHPRALGENNVSAAALDRLNGSSHAEWIRAALDPRPELRPKVSELIARLRTLSHPPSLPALPERHGVALELGATA